MADATKWLWQKGGFDHAVSGGAAWSDHTLVELGLAGIIAPEQITLHLPAAIQNGQYINQGFGSPGGIANHYHRAFSNRMRVDTIGQIETLLARGAKSVTYAGGTIARNGCIAMDCAGLVDALLAYTYCTGMPWAITKHDMGVSALTAGLNPKGSWTLDTWNRARCLKDHACLD